MDHFKVKLLNVASGKFDDTYSLRFKGVSKQKRQGVGFMVPSQSLIENVLKKVTCFGPNMFIILRFSNSESFYTVDVNTGICECAAGHNGSVCKHQYVLWSNSLTNEANFLPYLNSEERNNYTYVAIGRSLET